MKKQISLFTLAAALVAVPVFAAPGGARMGDANGDGSISRTEAITAATAMFAKMDVNKDGKLDAADRAAQMAERQTKMFAALDGNSDGNITRAEWDAHSADRQAKRAEKRANWAEKRAEGAEGAEAGKRGGQRMGGKHGKRGGHRGGMAMMMKADTNGDKAISQVEFQTAALARFDGADANKDGQVTAAERTAAMQAMRAQHRAARAPTGE